MWNDNEGARNEKCGPENVNYTEGGLTSPGYPQHYPKEMDCNYSVRIPKKWKITIVLNYFKLEDPDTDGSCSYDYLKIVHKINQKTSLLALLCGEKTRKRYDASTEGGVLVFTFHTDKKNQEKGFDITFEFISVTEHGWDGIRNCSSLVDNTLKSTGYPYNRYPNNWHCEWEVPIPQNMTMNISFTVFELEYESSCRLPVNWKS
ncbi:hypothetical protein ACROYT_G000939 [Oculina patagonica]